MADEKKGKSIYNVSCGCGCGKVVVYAATPAAAKRARGKYWTKECAPKMPRRMMKSPDELQMKLKELSERIKKEGQVTPEIMVEILDAVGKQARNSNG